MNSANRRRVLPGVYVAALYAALAGIWWGLRAGLDALGPCGLMLAWMALVLTIALLAG